MDPGHGHDEGSARPELRGFHSLLVRAQEGDREAMDKVLSVLRPHLEPLVRNYADPDRRAESTQDLLQDSCLRAWQKIDSFESGDGDERTFAMFRGWLSQIVKNLGIDAQRARNSRRRRPSMNIVPLGGRKVSDSTSTGGASDPPSPEFTPNDHAQDPEGLNEPFGWEEPFSDPGEDWRRESEAFGNSSEVSVTLLCLECLHDRHWRCEVGGCECGECEEE